MYDLREHIDTLKRNGELVEINEEVDWHLEVSALSMMMARVGGKGMLFNKIKGYPPGYRMVTGMYSGTLDRPHHKMARVLGMDPDCSRTQFQEQILKRTQSPLKPVEVATGPCKEVIKVGKDVNLFDFPFPVYAQGDGGRYSLNQAHINKDPDSDWVNWANYRAMFYSRNRYAIGAQVGAQFEEIFIAKYLARGQSMPVATVIGGDPLIFFTAGMALPPGMSEADVAGGLRQAPLELVRCESSDLLVPADAEIVIEGELRPNEYLPEGPLTESSLFQASPRLPNYGVRVTAITHRKNPIVPILSVVPGGDQTGATAVTSAAMDIWARYGLGLPIKAGIGARPALTLSIEKAYPGILRDAADRIMHAGMFAYIDSLGFVDGDVNPFDYEQLLETYFTQLDPGKDIWRTDNDTPKIIAIGPYLDDIDMQRNRMRTGVVCTKKVFDCTSKSLPPLKAGGKPAVRRINFETSFPLDVQEWVVHNWQRLGFQEAPRWNKPYMDARPVITL